MGQMLMTITHRGENLNDVMEPYFKETNINPKWEWFSIGGMWRNFISLKNGGHADSAPIKDIDFDNDERYYFILNWWYSNYDKFDTNPETREFKKYSAGEFARMKSRFYARNLLVDGKWICFDEENVSEKEWAESFYDRFIKERDESDVITIVDYE